MDPNYPDYVPSINLGSHDASVCQAKAERYERAKKRRKSELESEASLTSLYHSSLSLEDIITTQ